MKTHPLTHSERIAWLRLARSQNVGPVTFAALLARYGSVRAALDALPQLARRGGGIGDLRAPDESEAEQELEALDRLGGRLIACVEPDFPVGLAALDPPPPLICVLGQCDVLCREMIAIVGARNASALGRKFAGELARDLGAAGLVVVSGLARGIDTAAHQGALGSGTVAVLAGGVDDIYPPENAQLYAHLIEHGAIVSEMAVGRKPQAKHFPLRNRIISGLSRGVIVVEAAEGSGSLITARYALEQGREVFAVPGSPLDPRAKGTNRLLRDGAVLVESAASVIDELRPLIGGGFRDPGLDLLTWENTGGVPGPELRREIEELLSVAAVPVDDLIRQTRAPAAAVVSVLLELELAGRLQRDLGNRVALKT